MSNKSIKKNFFYQSAYQILLIISPLITSPYIARTLGNTSIGTYSYFYSISYYFGIFCILGLANYGNRCIARSKEKGVVAISRIFKEIITLQIFTSFVALSIYLIAMPFFSGPYIVNAFIEVLYILSIALDISWFFFGIEEFKTTTLRSFYIKLLMIISIILFVKSPSDLNVYTFIMAGGMLISSITLWTLVYKYIVPVKIKFRDSLKHLKPNIVLFIPVISLALFHYMDKIMLGSMSTMDELGYYTNADKVINIPMGLISGLGTVMLPRMSALSVSKQIKKINEYINKSILFSLWIGSALCFGIISICYDFVPFFFGDGYERCIKLLEVFSIVIIVKGIANVFRMQYLIPLGKDKEFNISVIMAAMINVIFNFLFIPRLGALGAVFGTLIAETVVLILYSYYSLKELNIKEIIIPSIIFILSGLLMFICIYWVRLILPISNHFLRLCIEIIFGGGIYCSVTVLTLFFTKRELLRNIFRR